LPYSERAQQKKKSFFKIDHLEIFFKRKKENISSVISRQSSNQNKKNIFVSYNIVHIYFLEAKKKRR
jgi:hypothetical protein